MKKYFIIIIIIFFIPLLILGVLSIAAQDETVSIIEKRELAKRPSFSLDVWFDGSFTSDFETYYTDTFPMRDKLLTLNQMLNCFYNFTLNTADSVTVIPFEDTAAPLGNNTQKTPQTTKIKTTKVMTAPSPIIASTGTTNTSQSEKTTTDMITPSPTFSYPEKGEEDYVGSSIIIVGNRGMHIVHANENAIARYADTVSRIAQKLDNVTVYNIIVPTSGEFYSPEYYHTGNSSQKDMIELCYEQMINVVAANPYQALINHADEYIYFNTDHHWTALGAYYAYKNFCAIAGYEAPSLEQYETGRYNNFIGSLYGYTKEYPQSKKLLKNPDYVTYYLPITTTNATRYRNANLKNGVEFDVINTEINEGYADKYLCFVGGDQPLIKIDACADNGKSCILVKESFGNAFAPFLTDNYETVFIIDPRKFNNEEFPADFNIYEFAKIHDINDVIIINNTFNINSYAYAAMLNRLLYN